VESKDSKAKTEKKVKDVAAVKVGMFFVFSASLARSFCSTLTCGAVIGLAFDHFDADHSGFIDKAEFASLSADLGELLDDQELSDAVKEIDVSM
jgi:hypothetical protein